MAPGRVAEMNDIAFEAACRLVSEIDRHLSSATRHYRTRAGLLLWTLDQVIRAILADDLTNAGNVGVDICKSQRVKV